MRIRLPFAGVFFLLLLVLGYAGLTSLQLGHIINDKILHLGAFFLLTAAFYWILDTNRRRTLNLTLTVCTFALGVGSEFLQGFLPNDREFDFYDIVANVVGSLAALGICSWYHQRMLERRRIRRGYGAVPGENDADVELGEGSGHETGVIDTDTDRAAAAHDVGSTSRTLEAEVDNWDENAADDWPEDDEGDIGKTNGTGTGDSRVSKAA